MIYKLISITTRVDEEHFNKVRNALALFIIENSKTGKSLPNGIIADNK